MIVAVEISRAEAEGWLAGNLGIRSAARILDGLMMSTTVLQPEDDDKARDALDMEPGLRRWELRAMCRAAAERLEDPSELTDDDRELLHRLGWLAHAAAGHAWHAERGLAP